MPAPVDVALAPKDAADLHTYGVITAAIWQPSALMNSRRRSSGME